MGLTAGCAVCHDHKFDPLSTKEFYSMYSFFHSAADPAMDGNKKDTPPILRVPRPGDKEKLVALEKQIAAMEERVSEAATKVAYIDPAELDVAPEPTSKETVWIEDGFPAKATRQGNKEWKTVSKPEPVFSGGKAFVLEANGLVQLVIGGANPPLVIEKGMKLFTHVYLDTLNPPKQIMLQFNDGTWEHRAYWGDNKINWGKDKTTSRHRLGDLPETGKWVRLEVDATKVGLKPGAKINGWAFTHFDGKAYWDKSGAEVTSDPAKDPAFSYTVWKAQPENVRKKDLPDAVWRRLRGKTPDKWTDAEQKEAFVLWIERVYAQPPKALADLKAKKTKLAGELDVISKNTAITFVMADLPKPRQSYVMIRGQYNQPGEKVSRNVPSFLPPLPAKPKERDYNRLDFANWLVSGQHPLTARVWVNRVWKHHFGRGIVSSLDNFGKIGAPPTHPALLDWLALELVENRWSTKHLHRLICTSAAYRQSSLKTGTAARLDPENYLLSRMPMRRLDAEELHDGLIAITGRLNPRQGGKPDKVQVREGGYVTGEPGEGGWRRSVYIQQRRKHMMTLLETFDLPAMNPNCVNRVNSTVVQQPLFLLHDKVVHSLTRKLAADLQKEAQGIEPVVKLAFERIVNRPPTPEELKQTVAAMKDLEAEYTSAGLGGQRNKALAEVCHALFNSAAFLYID